MLIIALCLLLLIWEYTPVEDTLIGAWGEDGPTADPVWGRGEKRIPGGGYKGGGGPGPPFIFLAQKKFS